MSFLKNRAMNMKKFPYEDGNRRTGRSTANALGIISVAMLSPGTSYQVYDHSGDFVSFKRLQIDLIRDIISKLKLEGFTYSMSDYTIKYNPFVEVTEKDKVDIFVSKLENLIKELKEDV